jgi:hypothetical protein
LVFLDAEVEKFTGFFKVYAMRWGVLMLASCLPRVVGGFVVGSPESR